MRSLLPIAIALALLPGPAKAMQVGVPMARIEVSAKLMDPNCITKVSPMGTGELLEATFVVVRVVVSKTGSVFPVSAVSGPSSLQAEAMNTVRLWRYKPFIRDGEAMSVNTEVRVDFVPKTPGGMVSHPKLSAVTQ
jgi:periplasmic protein TonB